MSDTTWYPSWKLDLEDPDEDGMILATPTGWPGSQPPGDKPLLCRTGVKGEFCLYSAIDRTDPVTDEVTFLPEVLPYLRIPCPICGDDTGLIIQPPIPKPDRLPPLVDAFKMRRVRCYCRECRKNRFQKREVKTDG